MSVYFSLSFIPPSTSMSSDFHSWRKLLLKLFMCWSTDQLIDIVVEIRYATKKIISDWCNGF